MTVDQYRLDTFRLFAVLNNIDDSFAYAVRKCLENNFSIESPFLKPDSSIDFTISMKVPSISFMTTPKNLNFDELPQSDFLS